MVYRIRSSCMILKFPCITVTWRQVEQPWIIFHCHMYGSPVFRAGARVLAGAAIFPAGKRASVFYAVLRRLRAVMVHASTFPAYRNSIFANGKVVLVSQFDSAFFIQVNKRSDMRTPAVFIIGHCIMGRIKEQFCDVKVRKESYFNPKKTMQEPWES